MSAHESHLCGVAGSSGFALKSLLKALRCVGGVFPSREPLSNHHTEAYISCKCSTGSLGLLQTNSYNLAHYVNLCAALRLVAFSSIPFCVSYFFSMWLVTP